MVGFTVVAVTWGFGQLEKVMGLGRRLESDGTFAVGLTVVRLGGSGGMKMDDGEVGILCDLGGCFGCWLIEG